MGLSLWEIFWALMILNHFDLILSFFLNGKTSEGGGGREVVQEQPGGCKKPLAKKNENGFVNVL